MFYTVYKITNKINGKIYIGKHQTNNLNDNYQGSGILLKHAYKKYGDENFTKEILFVFETEDLMNQKEAELVTEQFCSNNKTYNLCPGGAGGFGYINNLPYNSAHTSAHAKRMVVIREEKFRKNPECKEAFCRTISKSLKEKHASNTTFNSNQKTHLEKIQKIAVEKARAPKSISKRKNSYKQIAHQQGSKNSQYGKCWVFHPDTLKSISIKKSELDAYVELGYKRGRKLK